MYLFKRIFLSVMRRALPLTVVVAALIMPGAARADWAILDGFNLAPFVPLVLDTLMAVATAGYNFFVGDGDGIIYILVWGFLGVSLALYLVKLYFPKLWLGFFGFSGGGDMASGKATGWKIAENMLKPAVRAIVAATLLLQIKPVYMTQWLVNPFLEFGALYTSAITDNINRYGTAAPDIECPPGVLSSGWVSQASCEFLVKPVAEISHANNQIIKRGFEFINSGLRGLITLVPHGGQDFLNLITGILLVSTFVASNLFMALLIIQAIFTFGMSLALYPFQVLTYVVKPSDKWLDIWPAFSGITKALQSLIITMIACAFILCVNVSVIRALFQWSSSVFVVAAGGSASSNVPQVVNAGAGFGSHSVLWLSAILTFYLMFRIFNLTKEQLMAYAGGKSDALYKQVTSDAKNWTKVATNWGQRAIKIIRGKSK